MTHIFLFLNYHPKIIYIALIIPRLSTVHYIVYDQRAQNLRVVAPMPEQIETPTMHFPKVSGVTYQKFSSPKLGEMDRIDVFFISHVMSMGKNQPQIDVFRHPLY